MRASSTGTYTWLTAGLFAILTAVACRSHTPALEGRSGTPEATVVGTVSGPRGAVPIDDRIVEAINLETNQRQRVTTDGEGAFSFKLSPGKYRVELPLRDGEALVKEPGVIHVTGPSAAAHADFIVGTGRASSRPRGPAYRIFEGLGHPIG